MCSLLSILVFLQRWLVSLVLRRTRHAGASCARRGRGPGAGTGQEAVLPGVTDGCRGRCRRHPGPGLSPRRLWPCPRPPHRRLRFAQRACRGTRRDCRPRMRRRWRDRMGLPRWAPALDLLLQWEAVRLPCYILLLHDDCASSTAVIASLSVIVCCSPLLVCTYYLAARVFSVPLMAVSMAFRS